MTSDRDELSEKILYGYFMDQSSDELADAILASDWLARVKREAKAEALTDAADYAVTLGGENNPLSTWLRNRAAAIREQVK